jgi:hypothetical protein
VGLIDEKCTGIKVPHQRGVKESFIFLPRVVCEGYYAE